MSKFIVSLVLSVHVVVVVNPFPFSNFRFDLGLAAREIGRFSKRLRKPHCCCSLLYREISRPENCITYNKTSVHPGPRP